MRTRGDDALSLDKMNARVFFLRGKSVYCTPQKQAWIKTVDVQGSF